MKLSNMRSQQGNFKASHPGESKRRARAPGLRLHLDVDEFNVRSRQGNKHRCLIVDDNCRHESSQFLPNLKNLHVPVERAIEMFERKGFKVKLLSVDNQFITKEMKRMLPRHNCDIDSISPECHAQAGAAEVRHRGFNAAVRSILGDAKRDDSH